jgi:hypothetical protein
MIANNLFERPCRGSGLRLTAAEASWPAAHSSLGITAARAATSA